MGIAERKEREKEQRRNSILDAAEQVFFNRGIEESTMDDVAGAAELSKGTLYLYFKSKMDLLAAIHVRGLELLADKMDEAMRNSASGLERLQRLAHEFVRYSVENPGYFQFGFVVDKMQSSEEATVAPWLDECQDRTDRILSITIEAIKTGIHDGSISSRFDPQELALLLWSGVRGVVQVHHIKSKQRVSRVLTGFVKPLDHLMITFFDLLSSGLRSTKEASVPVPKTHKTAV